MNFSIAILPTSQQMAFISPVIRNDFHLYDRKRPQQRSRTLTNITRSNQVQQAQKLSAGQESTSLDSLLDKHKKLLQMREKRLQKRQNRRNTLNFRKISVITETDEENEDSLEELRQTFNSSTQMTLPIMGLQKSSEKIGNDSSIISSVSYDCLPNATSSSSEHKKKKKKSVLTLLNDWLRRHATQKINENENHSKKKKKTI